MAVAVLRHLPRHFSDELQQALREACHELCLEVVRLGADRAEARVRVRDGSIDIRLKGKSLYDRLLDKGASPPPP